MSGDMIDLHCHYIPGVDDGPKDLETALALARTAANDGITHAVVTPHVFASRWDNSKSSLMPEFLAFRKAVEGAGIQLEVELGGEVHLLPESLKLLDEDELPFIGGWAGCPVVLLEMHDGGIPVGAMRTIRFLLERGVVPMLAHPERNREVMRDVSLLEPYVRAGCLIQLTAGSLNGKFGRMAQRASHEMLKLKWVSLLATDAHNLKHRPPVFAEARDTVTRLFSAKLATELTENNPGVIYSARAAMGMNDY